MQAQFDSAEQKNGSGYWKSLDDLAETPAFREWAEREFPQGASELNGVDRRHFLKIMAASFGLAGVGLTGCRRPVHEIRPYARQPENIIPGVPQYYSSSRPTPFENIPLVVETHEARPTKIEGNPSYAAGGGATDAFTQASVLDLYDPSRAKANLRSGTTLSRAEVLDQLAKWSARLSQSVIEQVSQVVCTTRVGRLGSPRKRISSRSRSLIASPRVTETYCSTGERSSCLATVRMR